MNITFDETIAKLKISTGLTEDEIKDRVTQSVVSYEETLYFYNSFGRFPDIPTGKLIRRFGATNVINAMIKLCVK